MHAQVYIKVLRRVGLGTSDPAGRKMEWKA